MGAFTEKISTDFCSSLIRNCFTAYTSVLQTVLRVTCLLQVHFVEVRTFLPDMRNRFELKMIFKLLARSIPLEASQPPWKFLTSFKFLHLLGLCLNYILPCLARHQFVREIALKSLFWSLSLRFSHSGIASISMCQAQVASEFWPYRGPKAFVTCLGTLMPSAAKVHFGILTLKFCVETLFKFIVIYPMKPSELFERHSYHPYRALCKAGHQPSCRSYTSK